MFLNTTKKKFQVLKCVATREKNFKKNREKKDSRQKKAKKRK